MPVQEPYPATVPTKGKKSKKLVTKRRARTAAEFGVRRCSDRICCVASRMLLGQLRRCNIYLREWELQRGLPREHRSDNAALCACFMLLLWTQLSMGIVFGGTNNPPQLLQPLMPQLPWCCCHYCCHTAVVAATALAAKVTNPLIQ